MALNKLRYQRLTPPTMDITGVPVGRDIGPIRPLGRDYGASTKKQYNPITAPVDYKPVEGGGQSITIPPPGSSKPLAPTLTPPKITIPPATSGTGVAINLPGQTEFDRVFRQLQQTGMGAQQAWDMTLQWIRTRTPGFSPRIPRPEAPVAPITYNPPAPPPPAPPPTTYTPQAFTGDAVHNWERLNHPPASARWKMSDIKPWWPTEFRNVVAGKIRRAGGFYNATQADKAYIWGIYNKLRQQFIDEMNQGPPGEGGTWRPPGMGVGGAGGGGV